MYLGHEREIVKKVAVGLHEKFHHADTHSSRNWTLISNVSHIIFYRLVLRGGFRNIMILAGSPGRLFQYTLSKTQLIFDQLYWPIYYYEKILQ